MVPTVLYGLPNDAVKAIARPAHGLQDANLFEAIGIKNLRKWHLANDPFYDV